MKTMDYFKLNNTLRIAIPIYMLTTVIAGLTAKLNAQTFCKTYGGPGSDIAFDLIAAQTGGYVICGRTASFGQGGDDAYLIRTDEDGDILWSQSIGGSNDEAALALTETNGRNIVFAGYTSSFGAGSFDCYVVMTDSTGNILWTRTIGGTGDDKAHSVIATADGGIVISGTTDSYGLGSYDAYVTKLDSLGNVLWTRTIGGTQSELGSIIVSVKPVGFDLVETPDGGIVIAGHTKSYTANTNGDAYVVKIDNSGNIIWSTAIGDTGNDNVESIALTPDGGFIVAGYTSLPFASSGTEAYAVKLDSLGNLEWTRAVGDMVSGTFSADMAFDVVSTMDGGYAMIGASFSYGAALYDKYLIKMNALGAVEWTQTYGDFGQELGYGIVQDSDGNYLIAGGSSSSGEGSYDISLVKADFNGYSCCSTTSGGSDTTAGVAGSGAMIDSGGVFGTGGIIGLANTAILNTYCQSVLNEEAICNGDSIFLEGAWQMNSGLYYDTLTAANGSDSIVTTELSVHFVDVLVSQSGTTLTANNSGASYQWVDCNNGYSELTGETSQSFTATSNGSYAVIVTDSACIDTSSCYTVTGIGISEGPNPISLSIYPNPSNGILNATISLPNTGEVLLQVYSLVGELIHSQTVIVSQVKQSIEIDLSEHSAGAYLLRLGTNSSYNIQKTIIKK